MITHSTPATTPIPVHSPAPTGKSESYAASGESSSNGLSASTSSSTRSRHSSLPRLAMAGDVLLPAALVDEGELAVVLGDQLEQLGPVRLVRLAPFIDVIGQEGHRRPT